ncbi:hypothetical protein CA831_10150 [Burkholderia multivorans]|nr:hypothetical protein CA831_10150 [Burkholderia multivorans]
MYASSSTNVAFTSMSGCARWNASSVDCQTARWLAPLNAMLMLSVPASVSAVAASDAPHSPADM